MQSVDLDFARRDEIARLRRSIVRLKWHIAATRFEIAMRRHDRALKLAYKYGYNPDQPRVPAGDPAGGQWTNDGGASTRVRLAGDVPTGDSPPEIPKKRPPTSGARRSAYKAAARWLERFGGPLGKLIEGAEWLREHSPLIQAYRDPPKSLEDLQSDASNPALGYDIHHIVRRDQTDVFGWDAINSPDNLVRIPRLKHWDINSWYETPNKEYGGESPREYLNGRNWDLQRAVGLEALRKFGVLKP